MADTLNVRVARLEVTTQVLDKRTESMDTKIDLAIERLDKMNLNGQTPNLKLISTDEVTKGLVTIAKLAPELKEIVRRHRDAQGFANTFKRFTAWGTTRQILIMALGSALGLLMPHFVPGIIHFLSSL